jgi:hypothetical protein
MTPRVSLTKRTPPTCFAACFAIALAVLAAAVAPARASHTVTGFTVSATSLQAGGSPNASSSTSLSYGDATEDVKKTIGHFARGLIANPEAVPHCPENLFRADACPPDTRIGEAAADVTVFGGVTTPNTGRIYNEQLLAGEAGRLGIIVDTVPEKTFLTAPFYLRDTDYGLDGILDDIPRIAPGVQITRLAFTLYGDVQGRHFTRAPTSCTVHTSTGEAYAYDHPEPASGPSSSLTPTGCERVPFKPGFRIVVGSKSENRFGSHPPVNVTVTQVSGEAAIASNGTTLPHQLTPNLAAFQTICTAAQLAAKACPAASQVGTTTATSAFVAQPLSGPVYVVQLPGSSLPSLVAELFGRVHVRITIANSLVGGRQIRSTVTDAPDLPLTSFSLALNGGAKGVLLARSDLCFASSSHTKFRALKAGVTFGGHNGANVSSSPRIGVGGCPPSLKASLRGAGRRRARLSALVKRHPDAQKMRQLELGLPKALTFVRSKVKRRASGKTAGVLRRANFKVLGKRKLRVVLPSGGASKVLLKLPRGAVRVKRNVQRSVRRGRKPKLRFEVVAVDTAGQKLATKATSRARR